MASISSWLFVAADAAGLGGGAAGFAGAAAGGGVAGRAADAAGAAGAAAGCFAPAASGAFPGLPLSSSAMIRRMEARISSIEGSWAFAVWVIP
jgi:hypothetical protein